MIPSVHVKKYFFYASLIGLLSALIAYPKTIDATVRNIEDASCMLQGVPPVARCKPSLTITSNYTVTAFNLNALEVDNGSYDPDGGGVDLSLASGDLKFGSNMVTLKVTDQDNNTSTCESHVVIIPDYGSVTPFDPSNTNLNFSFYSGTYKDYYIPYEGDNSSIGITLNGGDGGWAKLKGDLCTDNCKSRGGYGAKVVVVFEIGCGSGKLEPGGIIRYIIGEKGTKHNGTEVLCAGGASGSGGGGTGLLYKGLNDDNWTVLAAAGGGGGAYQGMLAGGCVDSSSGRDGNTNINGDARDGKGSIGAERGGEDGKGGGTGGFSQYTGCGGGYLTDGAPVNCLVDDENYYGAGKAGGTTGGAGGSKEGFDCAQGRSGGFGFGGGGLARDAGAGGGGYSGGGAGGSGSGGGGGGSYVNTIYATSYSLTTESYSNNPEDGYITHRFLNSSNYASQTTANCISSNSLTVNLDENGDAILFPYQVDNGSVNNCNNPLFLSFGLNTFYQSFDCDDLGTQSMFLMSYSYAPANSTILGDYSGANICSVSVKVEDNIPPVASCKNFTAQLGSDGTVTLNAQHINDGSSDNCGIDSYSLDKTFFNCDEIGTHTVTLTVEDEDGNSSTCSSTVTVSINPNGANPCCNAPVAVCNNIQITLGSGSTVSITPSNIDNGSTADCNIAGMSLDVSTFDCDDLGDQTVTLTVTDDDGETGSCSATVTISESYGLIARCKNINVQLGANGEANILPADIDDGSESECGNILSASLSNTFFDCNNMGTNTVTLTVTDEDDSSTCTATVTVEDNTAPTANCISSLTIELDATGSASIQNDVIDNNSTDNCSIASISLNQTTFDCDDVGTFTLIQTVTDQSGNTATCSVSASVEDNIAPTISCRDITLQLDEGGEVQLFVDYLIADLSERCFPINVSIDEQYDLFDCNDIGTVVVPVMITDASNNLGTCNSNVTIVDDEAPTAICKDATVVINGAGNGMISISDIDDGSSDNCGIFSYSLSRTSFSCSDVGDVSVTLNATDPSGNSSSCTSTVTVLDEMAPFALCNTVFRQLDANGSTSVTVNDINNGSNDVCGIASYNLSQTTFDCSDTGTNTVTLTVTDVNGNVGTCNGTVVINDNIKPTASCQNHTVQLGDDGEATVAVADINNGSSDNCGIASIFFISRNVFNCDDAGTNQSVSLNVIDNSGNFRSCTASVTVQDNTAPTAICQDVTVILNDMGSGSISVSDINNGSSDVCGITSYSLSQTSFSCADVGEVSVMLSTEDEAGNLSTCTATVTVLDEIAPTADCQDVTYYLDENGEATFLVMDVAGNSTDNCGITSFSPSLSDGTILDCNDIGTQIVDVAINDASANGSLCSASITIVDNTPPTASCQNRTIQLDANGAVSISANEVNNNSTDNCSIASLELSATAFDCNNTYAPNQVTLTVTDNSGNTATCTATITVEDNIAPTAICQEATVKLDASGSGSISVLDINNGSTDVCGITSYSLSQMSFSCADLGALSVTLNAVDDAGNSSSCTATVTVLDEIAPTVVCQDVTYYLNEAGEATFSVADMAGNSTDNCGITSFNPSLTDGTILNCNDVGTQRVDVAINDVSANGNLCSANVTIVDNTPPTASCQNRTIQLDGNGAASITADEVNNNSSDACGIASMSVSPNTFDCGNTGANIVTLTVYDVNGNTASCDATVTVEDNIVPIAVCLNTTVEIQADGFYNLQESDVYDATNSSDNCAIASISFPATTFDCDDLDFTFPIMVAVTDTSNNTSNCIANVTIDFSNALPNGWNTNDIGSNPQGTDYRFEPCKSTGEFTIAGSGNNATSSTIDNVAFASQTLCGDGSITAKIENVSPNGYGGLMIRETVDADAKQTSIFSNLSNVLRHEVRYNTNGVKQVSSFFKPNPYWLKLERQGDWVFAYWSNTGSNFQYVHGVYLPMQNCVEIGLSSFTFMPNSQTEAVFSNVTINGSSGNFNGNNPNVATPPGTSPQYPNTAIPQHHNTVTGKSPSGNNLSLFPNPTRNVFTLSFSEMLKEESTATLRNQIGQVAAQRQLKPDDMTTEWDVSELPAGSYFMEVRQEGLPPQVLRVVKAE